MDSLTFIKHFVLLLVSGILILMGLWLVYQWISKRRLAFASSLPVVAPRRFVIGNIDLFLSWKIPIISFESFTKCFCDVLKKAAERRFETFCLWIGPKPQVIIQNPSVTQTILNNSKSIDKGFEATKIIFGEGLIVAPGPKWKKSRKLIAPVFHPSSLKKMVPIWNDSSSYLVGELKTRVNCGPVDLFPYIIATSFRSIYATMFGCEAVNGFDGKTIDVGLECMRRGADLVANTCFYPALWSDAVLKIFYKNHLAKVEALWNDFISIPMKGLRRKQQYNSDKLGSGSDRGTGEGSKPTNLIEALYDVTSDKELQDELKTMFGTGSETVAVTLCSCLLVLAKHQDIQENVYKEIVSVTGIQAGAVALEDLDDLSLLHRVLMETLRMFLVVPIVPRKLDEDIRIRDYTFPKGETVIISIVGLHFDPETYPDPEEFDPDRHTPENVQKRHPYSFLPFGGGLRQCIGKTYAIMSLKISLIHVLKEFKITTKIKIKDMRYAYRTTLASADGYIVEIERRN